MAFQYNHYYEIYNSSSGKYVNLNGDHENNVVNNGEKVTVYARTNNPDQRWALERYGSDNQVRIVLQRGGGWYALNYNTENTNCIVWHLNSAADKDTVITLEPAGCGPTGTKRFRKRSANGRKRTGKCTGCRPKCRGLPQQCPAQLRKRGSRFSGIQPFRSRQRRSAFDSDPSRKTKTCRSDCAKGCFGQLFCSSRWNHYRDFLSTRRNQFRSCRSACRW